MLNHAATRRVYVAGFTLAVGLSLLSAVTVGLAAPGKSAPNPPPEPFAAEQARALTRAEVGAPADARCLPVTTNCGCTHACSIGWPESKGASRYQIRSAFWSNGRTPLSGRIERFCANKQCTEAFFVETGCLGVCRLRPADATCHFNGDSCEGVTAAPQNHQ